MMESVITRRHIRNLVLAGFMGTGKSAVGRLAAARLRFRFVDTDALIEAKAGKRITEIFAQLGEPAFRELEREVVAGLGEYDRAVIATGGGVVVDPRNLASLREHALVVCLWASPETIYRRTRHSSRRPLLKEANPQARIETLLAQRECFYREGDILITTDSRSVAEVMQHVLHEFLLATKKGVPARSGASKQ